MAVLLLACGSIIYYNFTKTSESFMEDLDSDIQQSADIIATSTANYILSAKTSTQFIAWFSKNENNVLDASKDLSIQALKFFDLYPQIDAFYNADRYGNLVSIKPLKPGETYAYQDKKPLPKSALFRIRIINRTSNTITEFSKYLDKEGRVVAVQERERGTDYYDPRTRPWYIGAVQAKGVFLSDPYLFHFQRIIGITSAVPIFSKDGEERIIISADITMNSIDELLKSRKFGKTGITFILNQQGGIVSYPDGHLIIGKNPEDVPTYEDTKDPVLIKAYKRFQSTQEHSFGLKHEGVYYQIRFKPFGEPFGKKWIIGFIVPEHELTGSIQNVTELMMIFSLIIVSLSTLLIFLISRNISAPIRVAAETMARIAHFEIDDKEIKKSRFHEIFLMNEALRHMKRSLNDFSKFVPKAVVKKLMTSQEGAKIGGRNRYITLMFTDIKGFTTVSEKMSSEKLIVHLSDYLNELTLIIQKNKGTVDKYIGDAIMTFWGAPEDDPNHPALACKAAIECKERLEELNRNWVLDGKPPLYTRFGLHTGDAIVGNVGSEDRLNYSAFGDSVNLAARLEGINKFYGTSVTISQETYKHIRHLFICRPMDIVAVKGKSEAVPIYELLCEISEDQNKSLDMEAAQALSDLTTKAFNLYLMQEWDQALEKYTELQKMSPHDILPELFIQRCKHLKKNPPEKNWDGTHIMKEK